MRKRWWIIAVILVLAVVAGGVWQNHRQSSAVTKTTAQPRYVEKKRVHLVAVGDSLTHGQGDEKKKGGYVSIIKHKIEHHYRKTTVSTKNYGVSGDRSDQILARLNSQPKMRANLRKADVITMTVGGNDLMQDLEANIMNSPKTVDKDVDQAKKVYVRHLNQLLTAVRKQNPHAPVFIMSIYNPVYTYFPDVDVINDSIVKWNQTTQKVMGNYHKMYFVNINHLMSWGQYKTPDQRQQLIQQEKQANQGKVSQTRLVNIMRNRDHNLNEYISTEDNFHPNHRGYQQMANRLFKSMKDHNSWEYVKR
ncbi:MULTISPECIES: SGNH/GDSL hydrolase family protein [Limosilactobacillus]|uniref:SGNH hydrolase-type esterase domain-containing protein n=1 Tax=Limosilactobacillus panis DSM 6035 TaxID=1423782 RepID=A0A0R1X5I8_9LACO|nr:SGNH/GDSL hydrolase family protein [Limosilactobacillus panis]KRM24989.1 hypothetical protein FD32_GL001112 [Limosilactobacillus panis DSM 6035]